MIFDSGKYILFNVILQLIVYTKEKNVILFTYPPPVSLFIGVQCFLHVLCVVQRKKYEELGLSVLYTISMKE